VAATSLLPNMTSSTSDTFTKFDFDNDFFEVVTAAGTATPVKAPPKERAPRTFKEAGEQGYAKGLLQGRLEGQAEAEKNFTVKFNQQSEQLQQALNILEGAHTSSLQEIEQNLLGLLRHSLAKIVQHAANNYTDDILTGHLTDLLEEARNAQNLTLKIHPNATAAHGAMFESKGNITIEADPSLGAADCALEWHSGGLDKRLSSLMDRLDKLLLSAGATNIEPIAQAPTPIADDSLSQAATESVNARADNLIDPNDELVAELQPDATTSEPPTQ